MTSPAPLLPTRAELQPGATRAARELLAALAEGSVVVVDQGRAEAALAHVLIEARILAAQATAREVATMAEDAATRGARDPLQAVACVAWRMFADMVRRGYGVTT